jgi:adenylate cyclase
MKQTRELAAIMFADIKGFTRMMEEDEAMANLMRNRLVAELEKSISLHQGRIIKYTGDGALCIFKSAIEAVRCAIEVQLCMNEEPFVPLRIGIHSGDVLIDDVDIYGDSVNIASRVESFAVAGGIFISGKVNDEIKNQNDIETLPLGTFRFANVKVPMELFAISNAGIAVPNRKNLEGKGIKVQKGLRSKRNIKIIAAAVSLSILSAFIFINFIRNSGADILKSIAVLPFKNMSENLDNAYFTDGITEDILTQISKIGALNVISSSTMIQYKDTKKSVKEIGDELNVGAILNGSVRRLGNKIRIFVQLEEVENSQIIWSEIFDRDYSKIFDIQSEIAQIIANKLKANLSRSEKESIQKKPTVNLTAYEYYLKGRDYYYHYKKEDNEKAIIEFKKAIQLDPNYALAWAGLGDAYSQKNNRFGLDISWLDSSMVAGRHAIKLDSNLSEAYKALANSYSYKNQYDKAFPLLQKAVQLNPNNSPAVGNLGTNYFLQGKFDEALRWEKKAAALNPKNAIPYQIAGWTYRMLYDLGNAEIWLKKSLELKPYYDSYRELAFTYIAKAEPQKALKLIPDLLVIDSTNPRILQAAGLIAHLVNNPKMARNYFQASSELNPSVHNDPEDYSALGLAYYLLKDGKLVDADILLSQTLSLYLKTIDEGSQDNNLYYNVAAIYSIQNKKKEALNWMQKAIDAKWVDFAIAEKNVWFDNIRTDPQFKQMISSLKLKIAEMKKRADNL